MKQRYTLTIADTEIHVISDGSAETIEALVNNVDRKMREVLLANRRCSKIEAALLCALSYCADKTEAARKEAQTDHLISERDLEIRTLKKELEEATAELARLKESLGEAKPTPAPAEPPAEVPATDPDQVTLSEVEEEVAKEDLATAPSDPPAGAAPLFDPLLQIEPEDVDFDPVETFRMMKSRGQKKKRR